MLRYPVTLEVDTNDTTLVSFPDFPEAHTFGDDENEAPARAADLLEDVKRTTLTIAATSPRRRD
jgi:antitoxin HicB